MPKMPFRTHCCPLIDTWTSSGKAKLSTWLTAIIINSAGSKLRRHSRRMHISLDEADQTSNYHSLLLSLSDRRPNPEEVCRRQEFADQVPRLSKSLSPTLRRAFELHYVHGLSTEEMAGTLGVSNSAAKTQLSRARGRLKRLALGQTNRKSLLYAREHRRSMSYNTMTI